MRGSGVRISSPAPNSKMRRAAARAALFSFRRGSSRWWRGTRFRSAEFADPDLVGFEIGWGIGARLRGTAKVRNGRCRLVQGAMVVLGIHHARRVAEKFDV